MISDVASPPAEGSLASKDSRQVARTLAIVSEMRGIAATKPVPGVKLERDALVARVKDKALREYPPEALRREGLLLQIVGFAPPTFDYLGEMMKLLEAQLEGFYEPKNGTMYLAADLHGPQAQATLAHELVHALQDQKWDLKKRSDYKPGRGDEAMALACLAEGDATSLMLDFLMKPDKSALDIPDDALRELMASGMNMGDIQTVPHILRSTLIAPYMEGLGFVHTLRRKGDWKAVNAAWDRPPTTTEQILHVDKWEANEGPLTDPRADGDGARRRLEEGRRGHVRRARLRAVVRGVDGRRGGAQGGRRLGRRPHDGLLEGRSDRLRRALALRRGVSEAPMRSPSARSPSSFPG